MTADSSRKLGPDSPIGNNRDLPSVSNGRCYSLLRWRSHMRHQIKRTVVVGVAVIALIVIACGSDEPSSSPTATSVPVSTATPTPMPQTDANSDTGRLAVARERWAALGMADYDFRTNWQCFCILEDRAPVDLEVRGGEITGGVYAPDANLTSALDLSRYETVEGLFDLIADAIARRAYSIQAAYHPDLGYPESVWIDYDERLADEERGFNITKLTADSLGNTAAD